MWLAADLHCSIIIIIINYWPNHTYILRLPTVHFLFLCQLTIWYFDPTQQMKHRTGRVTQTDTQLRAMTCSTTTRTQMVWFKHYVLLIVNVALFIVTIWTLPDTYLNGCRLHLWRPVTRHVHPESGSHRTISRSVWRLENTQLHGQLFKICTLTSFVLLLPWRDFSLYEFRLLKMFSTFLRLLVFLTLIAVFICPQLRLEVDENTLANPWYVHFMKTEGLRKMVYTIYFIHSFFICRFA